MSVAIFEHPEPWTEEEYLALGETSDRIELFDGSLLVSPAPTIRHQNICARLLKALEPAAEASGLAVYLAINVRLRPGRIPIPDLVIAHPVDEDALVLDARRAVLLGEVTSSDPGIDRIIKMNYYADAGVPWYLVVEPKVPTVHLYRLDADHYVEESSARPGQILRFTAPVVTDLDPAVLLPRRTSGA
jgi:Uma2 family endonuclease